MLSVNHPHIYVTGGTISGYPQYSNNAKSNSTYEYDPITDSWSKKADMTIPTTEHFSTEMNGKIITIGDITYPSAASGIIQEYTPFQYVNLPEVPSGLTGIAGNAQNILNWDFASTANSYNVKRSTTPNGPYETIGTVTDATYTDTDVTNGTTYYYVVTALNDDGESDNSNEVALTPQDEPIPPSGNRAILVITLTTGERKEFDLPMSRVNDFISWYDGSNTQAYVFVKDYSKGPFTSRKDYVAHNQIVSFEVNEY